MDHDISIEVTRYQCISYTQWIQFEAFPNETESVKETELGLDPCV
jgi:hypothetical protein